MKRQKSIPESSFSFFDLLSEEIVFSILDCLDDNPLDRKAFSLVCKSFYSIESRHRKTLKPLRSEHLTKILNRYRCVTNLDLSLCPRITDSSLSVISTCCSKEMLRSINLSRSKFFSHVGLSNLVTNCWNLVGIDLSNATELKDLAASSIAEAKNLEKLWLVRCKSITDIGIGCIAVGCKKLKLLSLKWCLGVGDLGVDLIAVKCKDIRSLDLSYLTVMETSLTFVIPSISSVHYSCFSFTFHSMAIDFCIFCSGFFSCLLYKPIVHLIVVCLVQYSLLKCVSLVSIDPL